MSENLRQPGWSRLPVSAETEPGTTLKILLQPGVLSETLRAECIFYGLQLSKSEIPLLEDHDIVTAPGLGEATNLLQVLAELGIPETILQTVIKQPNFFYYLSPQSTAV